MADTYDPTIAPVSAPPPALTPASGTTLSTNPVIDALSRNIAGIESGGWKNPYNALGPQVANRGQAIGKYQVMPENVGPWTQQALGQAMTPAQFHASPEAQEAVFRDQMTRTLANYSPADAASIWFTGRPMRQAGGAAHDPTGTTNASYVARGTAGIPNAGAVSSPTMMASAAPSAVSAPPSVSSTPSGALATPGQNLVAASSGGSPAPVPVPSGGASAPAPPGGAPPTAQQNLAAAAQSGNVGGMLSAVTQQDQDSSGKQGKSMVEKILGPLEQNQQQGQQQAQARTPQMAQLQSRPQQISPQASQLLTQAIQAGSQPLTWSSAPPGSGAGQQGGQQMAGVPGMTLNSGYGYGSLYG